MSVAGLLSKGLARSTEVGDLGYNMAGAMRTSRFTLHGDGLRPAAPECIGPDVSKTYVPYQAGREEGDVL